MRIQFGLQIRGLLVVLFGGKTCYQTERQWEMEKKMVVWLCMWASRCPLTADHWRLDSVAVLAHTGASDANQPECMGKKTDIYVFVLYGAQRPLWLLVNASCWGLNHTSAKCEFYQIIRVLNHCLPTIVLTEECERGNKLLHGEWERVCACVCTCAWQILWWSQMSQSCKPPPAL